MRTRADNIRAIWVAIGLAAGFLWSAVITAFRPGSVDALSFIGLLAIAFVVWYSIRLGGMK